MSYQPEYLEVELPGDGQVLEICIGFAWGGDATKPIAPADETAFKVAVMEAVKAGLEGDRRLVIEMAEEVSPLFGQHRYRGGHTSERVQSLVNVAADSVTQKMRLSRPCAVVLVQR